MDNQTSEKLGKNNTGALSSPLSVETQQGALEFTILDGDENEFAENRIRYMKEAEPLGTIPMPTTLKGVVSSVKEKILTSNHVFMDKLGERIAFERTGTRLYEALISKHRGSRDKDQLPSLEILLKFHQEELKHFRLASEVMTSLGGDPTAITPAADVSGVAAFGWMQVMTDPRTNFKQCLEIILQAELVDNSCWEVLIELAAKMKLDSVVEQFKTALDEEAVHLQTIKQWVQSSLVEGTFEKAPLQ